MGLSIFDDNVPTEVRANTVQVMLKADKGEEKEEEKMKLTNTFCTKKIFCSFTNFECSSFVANATKT